MSGGYHTPPPTRLQHRSQAILEFFSSTDTKHKCWSIPSQKWYTQVFLIEGFTCPPGSYLDIDSENQDCKSCPAGTYSLGGGVLYDSWDHIPKGFSVSVDTFDIQRYYSSSRLAEDVANESCAR